METTNCKWQEAGQILDNDGNKRKCGAPQWQSYELQNLLKGIKDYLHPLIYSQSSKGFHEDINDSIAKSFTINAASETANDYIYIRQTGVFPNYLFAGVAYAIAAKKHIEIEVIFKDSTRGDYPVLYFETAAGRTMIGSGRNYLFQQKIILSATDLLTGKLVLRNHTTNCSFDVVAKVVNITEC